MKVLSIGNNKGGSAKTTTAVNLAVGLALKGKKTLLEFKRSSNAKPAARREDKPR